MYGALVRFGIIVIFNLTFNYVSREVMRRRRILLLHEGPIAFVI